MYRNETIQLERTVAEGYLRFCSENLVQLHQYIWDRDEQALLKIAVALSGNASRIGLTDLSGIGEELHRQTMMKNWPAVDRLYGDMVDMLGRLCQSDAIQVEVAVAEPAPPASVDISVS